MSRGADTELTREVRWNAADYVGVSEWNLILRGQAGTAQTALCFVNYPDPESALDVSQVLHPEEMEYFSKLKFEKRRKSFLLGRFCAKKAFSSMVSGVRPRDIRIDKGIFDQPLLRHPLARNMQVSISHCDDIGAALVFPESHPMGIDVERIDPGRGDVIEGQLVDSEMEILKSAPRSKDAMLALMWTVKEALSKVMKTGLTAPLSIYEISAIESKNTCVVSSFKNFGQYKAFSFHNGEYVFSIAGPRQIVLEDESIIIEKKEPAVNV